MSEETALAQTGSMSLFERLARDPAITGEKLTQLVEVQERIMAFEAKRKFDTAFADMQPKLPVITERGEILDRAGKVQSTYALWEDINDVIKPILQEHGFALRFRINTHGPVGDTASVNIVTGVLSHRDGHREESFMVLPADTSGNKNAVQAIGSSVSYAKRYVAEALLNITSRGQDTDGVVKTTEKLTPEQQLDISAECKLIGPAMLNKVLASYKVASLAEIPISEYQSITVRLQKAAEKHKPKEAK